MRVFVTLYISAIVGTLASVEDSLSDSKPFVLDLSAEPDDTRISFHSFTRKGVTFKSYTVKDGVLISSIVENGCVVWTATGDQRFKTVGTFARKNGVPELLGLFLSTGKVFFRKHKSGLWLPVTEELFEEESKGLYDGYEEDTLSPIPQVIEGTSRLPPFTHAVFDISKPSGKYARLEDDEFGGIHKNCFIAREALIIAVVDGNLPVWHAKFGETCLGGVYSRHENFELLNMRVGSDSGDFTLFFEKVDGNWVSVTRRRFYKVYFGFDLPEPKTRDAVETGPLKHLILAVSSPNRNEILVECDALGGVDSLKYSPLTRLSIPVFPEELETFSLTVSLGGKPAVLKFENADGEWRQVFGD